MDLKALFSAVIEFVKAAEAAYPQGGKGKDKFDMVAAQVEAFAPLVGVTLDFLQLLQPAIQSFTNTVVAWFNAKGLFQHAAAQPAAQASAPAA